MYVWLLWLLVQIFGAPSLEATELSLQGHWSQRYSAYERVYEKRVSCEVNLPLMPYFEVSLGYHFAHINHDYNTYYQEKLSKLGLTIPLQDLFLKEKLSATSANLVLLYPLGDLKTYIFGGTVARYLCEENFLLKSEQCSPVALSWNTGLGLAYRVNDLVGFKVNYTISPSVKSDIVSKQDKFDQVVMTGLSWML